MEIQMENFGIVLKNNLLYDLGCREKKFIWSNKHTSETFIKERLDRAIANRPRIILFKKSWVEGMIARCFDYNPILLTMNMVCQKYRKRKKLLKSEAIWITNEGCDRVVEQEWTTDVSTLNPTRVQTPFKSCNGAFTRWSKYKFKYIEKEIGSRNDTFRMYKMKKVLVMQMK